MLGFLAMEILFKQHKGFDPLGDCGKGRCPICIRNNALFRIKGGLIKEEFFSDAVAPFIGRFGYPNVNIGILAPVQHSEDAWLFDAPRYWSRENYEIPKIVDFRASLINSRYNMNIKKRVKLLELLQDIAMSLKPPGVEIQLKERPKFRLNVDSYIAPTGPSARLKKAIITQNPKIPTKVYKVFDDKDLKAYDAVNYLYKNDFDEGFLSKIFSVGTLGLGADRRLVPTRFSITAVDDIVGKELINKVKDYKVSDCLSYFGGYLGNYFLVLVFSEVWSYELFETYVPSDCNLNSNLKYTTDFESYFGRNKYAEETAGGYYAARLSVLEKLDSLKKQGSVLVLRFITDEYKIPLGVWVVREAVRKALSNMALEFSDKELMLNYAKALVKKKFNYDLDKILANSNVLKNMNQYKLVNFLSYV